MTNDMIYPNTFEQKIGFNEIRMLLKEKCMSPLGKEQVTQMAFSQDAEAIREQLQQTKEFRKLQEETDDFPMQYFFDVRESVARLRLEGTHMEEDELFDLRRSLETIHRIVQYLRREPTEPAYPYLFKLTEDVVTFPQLIQRIDQILDKFGKIKDSASAELGNIRRELAKTEGSISRTLYGILRSAQSEGLVEKDVNPTIRDGRLVIPIAPGLKRKIKGIIHDESASGKTLFIEPTEVAEERREIIRILTEFSKEVRPHIQEILNSYIFLAKIDFIQAKAELAASMKGIEPEVLQQPYIDWIHAVHPLLQRSLEKQGKHIVPLDIMLTKEKRILIISGPNAGGKSVCLKTTGLLQYMIQCGLSVPMSE